jgi:hypothetical protein
MVWIKPRITFSNQAKEALAEQAPVNLGEER